ncbi:MAG: alpha-ketoacid dehydrogenase subunit alpha/beta [Anaerolineae bacterium]
MVKLTALAPPAICRRLELEPVDRATIPALARVRMLALMHLIRAFENRVLDLKEADLVHGPAHTSVGQEAVAAGVAVALRSTDLIGSTHRAHGHFLAKALLAYAPPDWDPLRSQTTPAMQDAVYRTLAEIMGLAAGWCGGRGGSMHLYDRASGNLGSNAIVGGGIPLATGAAWAEHLRGRDTVVVSFFGDGAINQGCFHEVANLAALWRVPILYLIENNQYAVGTCTSESSYVCDLAQRTLGYGIDSTIVDGMDPLAVYAAVRDTAESMRAQPIPHVIEAKTYRFYHHAGRLRGSAYGYRSADEEAAWLARDPLATLPAELEREGAISSDDDETLADWAQSLADGATSKCTEMEEGRRTIPVAYWPPAETAADHLRGPDPLAAEAVPPAATESMTLVQAIAAVARRAMGRDEKVIVLGEEVANVRGGAYGATRGLAEAYPDRVFNTPISETGFLGMAGGAAALGMHPVVEVMFPDFALMASDQLFNQIGKLRHMYGGQVSFPLIVRTRLALGYGYGGQHSMDPAGLFGLFPGWRVVAPSNAADYIGLFNTALACDGPVLIMEHGMLYDRSADVPAGDLDYRIPYGQARNVRPGRDLTVLTYLTGVYACLEAAEALAGEGIEVEVIDLRTLDYTGMDYAAIGASLARTGAALVVEQAPRSQGIGARLADEIQCRWFDALDAPVAHVSATDVPPPVSRALETAVLPSVEAIEATMRRAARREIL